MTKELELTFDQWLTDAYLGWINDGGAQGDQRQGQWYMNSLRILRPEIYHHITDERPDVDPFYIDGKIHEFTVVVATVWDMGQCGYQADVYNRPGALCSCTPDQARECALDI